MKVTPKVMLTKKAVELVTAWHAEPPLWEGYSADETTATVKALMVDLAEVMDAGWETVRIVVDDMDLRIEPETGVMVAWILPEGLADRYQVDGGETDLHLTVCFLGDVNQLSIDQTRMLTGIVAEVAAATPAPFGVIDGTGTFENEESTVWFAVPQMTGLDDFQARLSVALTGAGFEAKQYEGGYTPHITLAYLEPGEEPPAVTIPRSEPLLMEAITVAVGGTRFDVAFAENFDAYNLFADKEHESNPDVFRDAPFVPFVKSVIDAPKRFTLGPWYIPNEVDSHGDWTDPDELQEALWRYVKSGYRGIHLQHSADIQAGEWVEAMTLPWEMTVPVIDMNGEVTHHIYPKGTVLLGVQWEVWAWTLVLEGKITGYSIGGSSLMRNEPAPPSALPSGPSLV